MGCNCGDNEYNIEIENNGSCEPTTPIYNISLGGVGVDGYSPTVEFINQTDSQFQIRVNDVNGTVISNAIPKLSFLIDNYVSNSVLASTLTAYSTTEEINTILEDYVTNSSLSTTLEDYVTQDYLTSNFYDATSIDALLQNITNNYLKKDGSNADSTINLNKLRLITNNNTRQRITTGSTQTELRIDGHGLILTGGAYGSQANPHTFNIAPTGSSIEIGNSNTNQIVIDNTSARYNGNEIATVNDIPDITTKLNTNGSNADSNFTVNGIQLTNNGIYKGSISYGGIHFTQTNPNVYFNLGIDSGRAYLSMPSFMLNSYPSTQTLINTSYDFKINAQGGSKLLYNNNEVATVNQIPTVNNSTITFTQGGVTKGTITLNQSTDQTIALDAGGGSVTNPIELTGTEVLQDPIPAEYKRLLDITFDGNTYYIYNGELYGTDDITLTMTPSVTSGQNVCGCYTNNSASDNFSLYISANTNGSYFRYGDSLNKPVFGAPQQRTITIGSPRTYGFSTDITGIAEQEFTTSTDFYIGALPNSTSAKFKGTFSGNIQISNRVVFIPVERISDGEIGYYIPSNNTFLENQGTGTPTTSGYDTGVYTSTKETTLTLGVETTTEETYLAPILTVDQSYTAEGTTTTNTFNIATEPWVLSQGYTSNVGTVTSVNNIQPDENGNVTISAGGSYTAGNGIDITNNEISIDNTVVATQTWVGNQGYLTGITGTNVINALGYTPMAQQGSSYNGNITIAANGNNTTMSLTGGRSGITLSNTGVNITPYSNNTLKVNNKPVLINNATGTGSLAILGTATASNAIQIGSGANSTANSLKIGNYSLLNTNTGYIVGARIPIDGTSITLNNSGQLQSSGGVSINDTIPSITTVYSSQKTQDLIDALVARIVALETNINGGNA